MHPASTRVLNALAEAGCDTQLRVLDESAHTAALAAAQLGVDVAAIANSLIFDADGQPLLVLTSGGHRVDTALVAKAIGAAHLRRATPEFVRLHTGQPIGGVAPVGHPSVLITIVDVELAGHQTIWAAAGHPRTVFATDYDTLVRITAGTPMAVA